MTLPDERYRSLVQAKNFMVSLLDPKKTPKVPKEIRLRAYSILRHFPDDYHLDILSKNCPEHFAKELEPLYKMVKAYDISKNKEK